MEEKEQAKIIYYEYYNIFDELYFGQKHELPLCAKICAINAVNRIIMSNPHSNPLENPVVSTAEHWMRVREELIKSEWLIKQSEE